MDYTICPDIDHVVQPHPRLNVFYMSFSRRLRPRERLHTKTFQQHPQAGLQGPDEFDSWGSDYDTGIITSLRSLPSSTESPLSVSVLVPSTIRSSSSSLLFPSNRSVPSIESYNWKIILTRCLVTHVKHPADNDIAHFEQNSALIC